MLTGAELLSKVKELGDVSKSDIVRACGYVSNKKDGSERLNFTAFYNALLEAKGISVGTETKGGGGRGRKLSYVTRIQFNGNLMVGKAYTSLLGLEPGDEFEIKLGRKQIKLIPIGSADEEGDGSKADDAADDNCPLTANDASAEDEDFGESEDEEGEEDEDAYAEDEERELAAV